MLNEEGTDGRLAELFQQYVDLSGQSGRDGEARDKHAKLTRQRAELNGRIEKLQSRQTEIENELRGLRFVSTCYKPWKRIRELNETLAGLPVIRNDPDEALSQLADCERDIQTHTSSLEKLTDQAQQLRNQADRLKIDERFDCEYRIKN